MAEISSINTVSSWSSVNSVLAANIAGINSIDVPASGEGIDEYVKLILHMDGADDGTVFTDDSINARVMTRYNAVTKTGVKQLGTASGYFDGTGDYLTSPDFNYWWFSDMDFTIDLWVRPATTNTDVFLAQNYVVGNRGWALYQDSTNIHFAYSTNGTDSVDTAFAWTYSINNWYHIAVVRIGPDLKVYSGGTQIGSTHNIGSAVLFNSTGLLYVGQDGASTFYQGYLDEVRISRGIGRWTKNFTPPTSAYANSTALTIGGNDDNTLVLIHANGADDGTTFTDDSSNERTITRAGVVTKTGEGWHGSASAYSAGSNNYIRVPDSTDWDYGSGDITYDFWVRLSGVSGVQVLVSQYESINDNMGIYMINTELFWEMKKGGVTQDQLRTGVSAIAANKWYHVACVKDGSTGTIYINGVSKDTDTIGDGATFSAPLELFGQEGGTIYPATGYIDEFRVSDIARWTGAFTPPPISYSETFGNDAYAKLMLHMDGADDGTVFTDDSFYSHTVTRTNVVTKTGVKKFNTASAYYDGTGDYLQIGDHDDFSFGTDPWTVDLWMYVTDLTGGNRIFCFGSLADGAYNMFFAGIGDGYPGGGNRMGFAFHPGSGYTEDYYPITTAINEWHHAAFVRNGTLVTTYFDGTSIGSVTIGANALNCGASGLILGARYDVNSSDIKEFYTGYQDELRVSRGIARWTSNFTPPTGAYS